MTSPLTLDRDHRRQPLALSTAALAELNHCNKCGFCLPACPTYALTGVEVHSPRGRLTLMEAAARGELAVGPRLADALGQCIGCRACETACPSGVRYGVVLESARAALVKRRRRWVVPSPAVGPLLRLVQHRRLLRVAATWGRRARAWPLPNAWRALTALAPVPAPHAAVPPAATHPLQSGTRPVHFVSTCVMGAVFPTANDHARQLLAAAGAHLSAPRLEDACCGALHAHTGDRAEAERLARVNIRHWDRELPADAWLVAHAGGCSAMMHDYGRLLADDPTWRTRAAHWSKQVMDFGRALESLPRKLTFRGHGDRVALQNSCHLVNVLGQGDSTVRILSGVAGDTFVSVPGQDRCCGAGGVYNLNQPEMASRILKTHVDEITAVGASVWIMNNPGCALHAAPAVLAQPAGCRVEHLATYLWERWVPDALEPA